MKKIIRSFILFTACSCLALAIAGCGTFGGLFTATPQVQTFYEPHQNVQSVTNPDGSIGIVTNTVMVPRYVTNGMTYTVSAGAQKIIAGGETVSSLIPPPYGTAATAGLGILSGVLGFIARAKSKKLDSVQSIADLVQPMIAGIEKAGDPNTKAAVQSAAVAAGVQPQLHQVVQTVTSQMPATPPVKSVTGNG